MSVKDPEDDYDDSIYGDVDDRLDGERKCHDCSTHADIEYGDVMPCCDEWICDECAKAHNMVRCAARLIRQGR